MHCSREQDTLASLTNYLDVLATRGAVATEIAPAVRHIVAADDRRAATNAGGVGARGARRSTRLQGLGAFEETLKLTSDLKGWALRPRFQLQQS